MAEIWLALLFVVTLGPVYAVTTPITVDNVKDAWIAYKPDQAQTEINDCDSPTTSCGSTQVDTAAADMATDLDALCLKVGTYSTCAEGCTLTETKKQELEAVEDLCKTAGLEKVVADITTGGNCDTATCPATAIDSASGLNAKCVAFYTYLSCAKGKCSSTLTDAQKQALQDMEDQCKTVLIADLEKSVADITTGGNCNTATCPTTAINSASELDAICVTSLTYIECVTTKCTSVDVAALKTPCKDRSIPLYDFGIALIDIKKKCLGNCDSAAVDGASDLDAKCLASETYLTCVTGAGCATDTDDDVVALKTPCQDTTTTSTSTTSSTDATAKTAGTTKDPADIVNDAWETFKQNSQGITSCDAKCPSSDVDTGVGSSDLPIVCQTVLDYTGCAVAKCNMSETDPLLVALTEPCPDDGDDGCSILQVSILALMLSLLLSII